MMTSQVVRKLEQKGLVKREPSKIDARAYTLNPTDAGIKLANQAVKKVEAVDKEFFDGLNAHNRSAFIKMMRALI